MQGYLATVITPWKNIEELVRVRALLYPEASDSGDEHNEVQRQKRLGINIVSRLFSLINIMPRGYRYSFFCWDSGHII